LKIKTFLFHVKRQPVNAGYQTIKIFLFNVKRQPAILSRISPSSRTARRSTTFLLLLVPSQRRTFVAAHRDVAQ
jgi:hypothetical protein